MGALFQQKRIENSRSTQEVRFHSVNTNIKSVASSPKACSHLLRSHHLIQVFKDFCNLLIKNGELKFYCYHNIIRHRQINLDAMTCSFKFKSITGIDPWAQKLTLICSEDVKESCDWGRTGEKIETFEGEWSDLYAWMLDTYMSWINMKKEEYDFSSPVTCNLKFETASDDDPMLTAETIYDIFTFHCLEDKLLIPRILLKNDLEFIQTIIDSSSDRINMCRQNKR